jgi:ferrochelatase
MPSEKYTICFQSRLGKEPWIQPYASQVLHDLAKRGYKKIAILSPSFVCDCLETLFEIQEEYALEFQKAGGEKLTLVPGLNDHPLWIEALSELIATKTSSFT